MVRRLAFPAPPRGWCVWRGVGAVGAAAGGTARRHRQGQHRSQALHKP